MASPTIAAQKLAESMVIAAYGGINVEILSQSKAKGRLGEFDIILLSPNLRHLLNRLHTLGIPEGIPVHVIQSNVFGDLNGKEVLKLIE